MANPIAARLKIFLPMIQAMLAKAGVTKGPEIVELLTSDARNAALSGVNDAAFKLRAESALIRMETADSETLLFAVTVPKVTS